MSGTCDLPMTDAGQAAVDRHRDALAAYGDRPAEWRAAYPGMVSAIIEAHARRHCLAGDTVLPIAASGENPGG